MTSANFNTPRLMGNCKNCYYFTPIQAKKEGICHRYPKPLNHKNMDYCGEFVWMRDVAMVKEVTR